MDKILVIEDDRAVQRALKRLFESEGYSVECSYDGLAGLESFRSSPEVVILNLSFPAWRARTSAAPSSKAIRRCR
jgi:DNA-binding response OmpR family regulator